MATLLGQLNIQPEEFASIEPEEVRTEGFLQESGLYVAAVDKAYIRKTDSGANMLEIDFKLEDGSNFHYSTCTASGDQKGNKTTYTSKQGKEVALPGVTSLRKFLDAIGVKDPNAVQGEVEHFGTKIKALCIESIQGKKLQIGINQYENFYNGEVSIKNDIKYFLDVNGKSGNGENLVEKVTESLEKKPLQKLRASATAPTTGTPVTGGSEASSAGW